MEQAKKKTKAARAPEHIRRISAEIQSLPTEGTTDQKGPSTPARIFLSGLLQGDISSKAIRMTCTQQFEKGSLVSISVAKGTKNELSFTGRVIWCQNMDPTADIDARIMSGQDFAFRTEVEVVSKAGTNAQDDTPDVGKLLMERFSN